MLHASSCANCAWPLVKYVRFSLSSHEQFRQVLTSLCDMCLCAEWPARSVVGGSPAWGLDLEGAVVLGSQNKKATRWKKARENETHQTGQLPRLACPAASEDAHRGKGSGHLQARKAAGSAFRGTPEAPGPALAGVFTGQPQHLLRSGADCFARSLAPGQLGAVTPGPSVALAWPHRGFRCRS